jgi:hypothetical protein
VRTVPYIVALLGAACLVPGCSDDPGSLTSGRNPYAHDYSGDPDGDEEAPAPSGPVGPAPARDATFADRTLARAREWITAQMPYCGGPNGGKDLICGGTCERSGSAEKPEWDDYRSDCSGFVSWAWELPAPGRTTRTLAPSDTTVSVVINVEDLAPGDALNGPGHVMLWGGWTDEANGKGLILQESGCGKIAHEKVATFEKIDATTLEISDGRHFQAIRYKKRPDETASR